MRTDIAKYWSDSAQWVFPCRVQCLLQLILCYAQWITAQYHCFLLQSTLWDMKSAQIMPNNSSGSRSRFELWNANPFPESATPSLLCCNSPVFDQCPTIMGVTDFLINWPKRDCHGMFSVTAKSKVFVGMSFGSSYQACYFNYIFVHTFWDFSRSVNIVGHLCMVNLSFHDV